MSGIWHGHALLGQKNPFRSVGWLDFHDAGQGLPGRRVLRGEGGCGLRMFSVEGAPVHAAAQCGQYVCGDSHYRIGRNWARFAFLRKVPLVISGLLGASGMLICAAFFIKSRCRGFV